MPSWSPTRLWSPRRFSVSALAASSRKKNRSSSARDGSAANRPYAGLLIAKELNRHNP